MIFDLLMHMKTLRKVD